MSHQGSQRAEETVVGRGLTRTQRTGRPDGTSVGADDRKEYSLVDVVLPGWQVYLSLGTHGRDPQSPVSDAFKPRTGMSRACFCFVCEGGNDVIVLSGLYCRFRHRKLLRGPGINTHTFLARRRGDGGPWPVSRRQRVQEQLA